MKRWIATACVLAMICGGVWAQPSAAVPPAPHKTPGVKKPGLKPHAAHPRKQRKSRASAKKKSKAEAVAPAPPLPAQLPPPPPATLMNRAPVQPTVTMSGGLLTIDAPNSTLSDVLHAIHAATGAEVEGASPDQRVAVRLGPGQPRQVIAALLQGTPYNYVILGSQSRPDAVTRILLTQPSASSPAQNHPAAVMPPRQIGRPQPPEERFLDRMPHPIPAQTSEGIVAEPAPQPPKQAPQPQPNTPEQLFRELLHPQPAKQP
jgi:hypothetical protein